MTTAAVVLAAATICLIGASAAVAAVPYARGAGTVTEAAPASGTNPLLPPGGELSPGADSLVTVIEASGPILVTNWRRHIDGYVHTAGQILEIVENDNRVLAHLYRHPRWVPYVMLFGSKDWEVLFETPKPAQRQVMVAYVDDATGRVVQVWTGYQVGWMMARGYHGAFGKIINASYVWALLALLFLVPLLPWRRPERRAPRSDPRRRRRRTALSPLGRFSLWHLDLAVLLSFGVSLAFFNHGDIGMSVPLIYPPMLYLLGRMLLLGFGRGRPRRPVAAAIPDFWLLVLLVFALAVRIGIDVWDSNVIDVGYAGVVGAAKLSAGQPLYGHWLSPVDGDTYGPLSYLAYVPFIKAIGWSGTWDGLPSAHAAAICFDLLTLGGLFWLGRRLRDNRAGLLLAYLWATFPFTAYVLATDTNDSLAALGVVLCLLALTWKPAGAWGAGRRGLATGLATMVKFAPLGIAPLMLRGTGPRGPRRHWLLFADGLGVAVVACMMPVLLSGDLGSFWHDTLAFQAGRSSPFSIWGLWAPFGGVLRAPERIVDALTVLLALAVARWPRGDREPWQVAALAAAVMILEQCGVTYWFYTYIVWWLPLVLAALVLSHRPLEPEPELMLELPADAAELVAV